MKLVDNARDWWKMFSLQANVINGSVLLAYTQLPDTLKAAIPTSIVLGLTIGLLVLGSIGRLVKQPNLTDPK